MHKTSQGRQTCCIVGRSRCDSKRSPLDFSGTWQVVTVLSCLLHFDFAIRDPLHRPTRKVLTHRLPHPHRPPHTFQPPDAWVRGAREVGRIRLLGSGGDTAAPAGSPMVLGPNNQPSISETCWKVLADAPKAKASHAPTRLGSRLPSQLGSHMGLEELPTTLQKASQDP